MEGDRASQLWPPTAADLCDTEREEEAGGGGGLSDASRPRRVAVDDKDKVYKAGDLKVPTISAAEEEACERVPLVARSWLGCGCPFVVRSYMAIIQRQARELG